MALIIKPTGEQYPIVPALGKFPINAILEIVNTPHIEVIPLPWSGKDIHMVMDVNGFNHKPFNATASREARRAVYGDVLVAKYEELGGQADA